MSTEAPRNPAPPLPGPAQGDWQKLATTGHVLLSRIDALRLRAKSYWLLLLAGVVVFVGLAYVAQFFAATSSQLTSRIAESIAHATNSAANTIGVGEAVATSPAPKVNLERLFDVAQRSSVRGGAGDPLKAPSFGEFDPALIAIVKKHLEGGVIDECDFTKKISNEWISDTDIAGAFVLPKCRYSRDKSRLWVWAIAADNYGTFRPVLVLAGKFKEPIGNKVFNLDMNGYTHKVKTLSAVPLQYIPRVLADDFPELKL